MNHHTAVQICLASFLAACGSEPIGINRVELRAFVTSSAIEPSVIHAFCPIAVGATNLKPVRHPVTGKESIFRPYVARNGVNSIPIPANTDLTDLPGAYWSDVRGNVLFTNKKSVLDGTPESPFVISEFGSAVRSGEPVWTGINPNDPNETAYLGYKCVDLRDFQIWTSVEPTDHGFVGQVGARGKEWQGGKLLTCDKVARIYCFETFPKP